MLAFHFLCVFSCPSWNIFPFWKHRSTCLLGCRLIRSYVGHKLTFSLSWWKLYRETTRCKFRRLSLFNRFFAAVFIYMPFDSCWLKSNFKFLSSSSKWLLSRSVFDAFEPMRTKLMKYACQLPCGHIFKPFTKFFYCVTAPLPAR